MYSNHLLVLFVHSIDVQEILLFSLQISEDDVSSLPLDPIPDALKYIIYTRPGPGPMELPADQCLLGEDGLPKSSS